MTFKYSICHPEKENIEYKDNPISGNEVMELSQAFSRGGDAVVTASQNGEQFHFLVKPKLIFVNVAFLF